MIDFDAMLDQDTFIGNMCTRCGSHGILIATPRYFGACPHCLAERMKQVRESGATLPDWFLYVERVAQRNAARQTQELLTGQPLTFDDFYRCADCDRVVHARDARYHFDPDDHSRPPYCLDCYTIRERGRR